MGAQERAPGRWLPRPLGPQTLGLWPVLPGARRRQAGVGEARQSCREGLEAPWGEALRASRPLAPQPSRRRLWGQQAEVRGPGSGTTGSGGEMGQASGAGRHGMQVQRLPTGSLRLQRRHPGGPTPSVSRLPPPPTSPLGGRAWGGRLQSLPHTPLAPSLPGTPSLTPFQQFLSHCFWKWWRPCPPPAEAPAPLTVLGGAGTGPGPGGAPAQIPLLSQSEAVAIETEQQREAGGGAQQGGVGSSGDPDASTAPGGLLRRRGVSLRVPTPPFRAEAPLARTPPVRGPRSPSPTRGPAGCPEVAMETGEDRAGPVEATPRARPGGAGRVA